MDDVSYIPKFWVGQKVVTKSGRNGEIVAQKTIYDKKTPFHVYFIVLEGNKSRTTIAQTLIDKVYKERKIKQKN